MEDELLASVEAFVEAFVVDEELQETPEELKKPTSEFSAFSTAKRRRLETKYTTTFQRQKRAELRDLREETSVLEARLKQLKRTTQCSGSDGEFMKKKSWVELEERAASELAARLRSEAANKELKMRLGRQAKLQKKIKQLVAKYQREEGVNDDSRSLLAVSKSGAFAAMTTSAMMNCSNSTSQFATFMATECGRGSVAVPEVLRQLVEQVDNVFASCILRPRSSWLESNRIGNTAEIWMSTNADRGVAEAADMLWTSFREKARSTIIVDKLYSEVSGAHSLRRSILPIQCRAWDDRDREKGPWVEVLLHLEHLSRRVYDQSTGRAVLVTFSQIRLPSEGGEVFLRERFWKCITPTNCSGRPKSITQTSYRIEPGDMSTSQLSPAQASVMRALVNLTRRNHSSYQERLLEASTAF